MRRCKKVCRVGDVGMHARGNLQENLWYTSAASTTYATKASICVYRSVGACSSAPET